MIQKIINMAVSLCFVLQAVSAAAGPAGSTPDPRFDAKFDPKAARAAFDANSCGSCHASHRSTIGPALKEIANRYRGQDVAQALAERIRSGSEGRWGSSPHPQYEALEPREALLMAKWILGGKPK